jgi:hypothetical protein
VELSGTECMLESTYTIEMMITVQYPLTRTSFQKEGYCCNHTATICYLLEGTTGVAVADIWFFYR